MDITAVLALVQKAIQYIPLAIEAGQDIAAVINLLKTTVDGAQAGTLTPDQLAQQEAELDALIADFNTPID